MVKEAWVSCHAVREGKSVFVPKLFGLYPREQQTVKIPLRLCEGPATVEDLANSLPESFHRKGFSDRKDFIRRRTIPRLNRDLPQAGLSLTMKGSHYELVSTKRQQKAARPPGGGVGERSGSSSLEFSDGYLRATAAKLAHIRPQHNELARKYSEWLKRCGCRDVCFEKDRVDIEFEDRGCSCRAELKVCGDLGTTKAIRDALGQTLEYNFYPGRQCAERLYIVLDSEPTNHDQKWIKILSKSLSLPLRLYWPANSGFAHC